MEVNELMIGNFVQRLYSKKVYKVTQLYRRGVVYLQNGDNEWSCSSDEIHPIPITIEWLLKNGFKKEYEELCFSKEIDGYYIDITFRISNRSEGHIVCHVDNNDRQTVGCADILYIHQLQNLLNILNIKEEFIV